MTTLRALALAPAAILSEANVWRHSCRVIGVDVSSVVISRPSCLAFSSPVFFQAFKARLRTVEATNTSDACAEHEV
jgi:hypothetical protein